MNLKIEYLPKEDLKPYANNAKRHPAEQVEQIKSSIREFGFNDPIAVWKDNEVIEGHGRLLAAMEMDEIETVPVIRLDDLTDEQRRAYMLVHNKLTMNTDFDLDMLAVELDDIFDIDMSDFGFEFDTADDPAEVIEDEAPEPAEEPKTKLGDIYQLGKHRLICGDSTDPAVIDRLMDGVKAKLALTDPPYGVNIVQHDTVGGDKPFGRTRSDAGGVVKLKSTRGEAKNAILKAKLYMPIIGDESTKSAENHYKIIRDKSEIQIIFGGNYFTDFLPPSRCWIVWDKGVPPEAFFAPVELAWCSKDGNAKLYKWQWSGICREGQRQIEGKSRIHPTQKPVGMLANIIKDYTEEYETVIDGFGGSGSTLIACEQLNRKCYMAELDPKYVSVILQRYINFKGSDEDVFLLKDGKKIPYSEVE